MKAGAWLESTPAPSLALHCCISGETKMCKKGKGSFAWAWSFSAVRLAGGQRAELQPWEGVQPLSSAYPGVWTVQPWVCS